MRSVVMAMHTHEAVILKARALSTPRSKPLSPTIQDDMALSIQQTSKRASSAGA